MEHDIELELFERIRRLPLLLRLLFFRESTWHCYDHDTLLCRRCFELASLLSSKEDADAL